MQVCDSVSAIDLSHDVRSKRHCPAQARGQKKDCLQGPKVGLLGAGGPRRLNVTFDLSPMGVAFGLLWKGERPPSKRRDPEGRDAWDFKVKPRSG